jgi:hypothetical protein
MTIWRYRVFSDSGFWCYAKNQAEAMALCSGGEFRYEAIPPIVVRLSD